LRNILYLLHLLNYEMSFSFRSSFRGLVVNYEKENTDFKARLQELIGDEKPFPWASRIGLTPGVFNRMWNEGVIPKGDSLALIAEKTGVSLDWLVMGKGPKCITEQSHGVAEPAHLYADTADLDKEYVLVPRYNVKVSAGGGSIVESEQVVDHLAFKSAWVRTSMHLNPSDLLLISAIGDSMYPAIREGDLLLVDKSQQSVKDDAIYVLRLNDSLIAKRLQKLYDGSVQIKSDNKAYDPQLVPHDRIGMLNIIGRVVWVGGRV